LLAAREGGKTSTGFVEKGGLKEKKGVRTFYCGKKGGKRRLFPSFISDKKRKKSSLSFSWWQEKKGEELQFINLNNHNYDLKER